MIIKKITTFFLALIVLVNIPLTAFAEDVEETTDAYEPSAPFVMLATDENGGITISCNKVGYFGNLSSASKINIWASEVNGNGLKLEQDESFVLNSFKDELDSYEYSNLNDVYISQVDSSENNPIKCNLYSNSSSKIDINSIINSQNNIDLCAQYINANTDNDQYLYSENGNINLNCESFDFSGIIYAPNGNVNICANKVNIEGFIFAKNITLNANEILIKENYDLYTVYENIDIENQNETELLIEEYLDTVDEISAIEDTTTEQYEELESQYEELHQQIEDKDMFLSEEEVKEFFEDEYEKSISTENSEVATMSKKAFKPCAGIEKMYDVIRKQGTYPYKKKSYSYYSMIVSDKISKSRKISKMWFNKVAVSGEIVDEGVAKKYLNKSFQVFFGKGAGKVLSSLGRPVAGSLVSTALSKIYPFGKPKIEDIVVKGRSFYAVDNIQVTNTMRYYWVKYNGSWQFAYACNYAIWEMDHEFSKLNPKTKSYYTIVSHEQIKLKGSFFKPYVAIQAIVDYKALYGKNANNGSSPFGCGKTPDLIVKDYKNKEHRYNTPFFKNPINLI